MIYLGPAGVPACCKTTEDAIKYIAKIGLNALEVQFVRGVKITIKSAQALSKIAEDYGVKLSAHAPYFINLNSTKKDTIKNSRIQILRTAEVADALNARIVTVHAGYYSGKPSASATAIICESIRYCADKIEQKKWDVLIGLETMGKRASWGSLDEIVDICRVVKNVVPVIDFAHIHARAKGCLKTKKDFEKVLSSYEKVSTEFLHSHFTCVNYGEKGERNHLTLAESKEPDFNVLAPVLKSKKYDITVISESPILEQDALRMKDILGS
jgi:deoxyribonuclease-4